MESTKDTKKNHRMRLKFFALVRDFRAFCGLGFFLSKPLIIYVIASQDPAALG